MIRGLIINRFPLWGIIIDGNFAVENTIIGNYIGTDFSGTEALGNVFGGIFINAGSSKNRIGGTMPGEPNIISGASYDGNINHGNGITINSSDDNIVYGNYIGTNRDGTGVVDNLKAGICIRNCANNIIGGIESGQGNIISGNGWCGICIRSSMNNTVAGNYIGTDTSGLVNLGNATVFSYANGGVILDFGAQKNIIGPDNLIAFNSEVGIRVRHDSTTGNTISQNSITQHSEFGIFLDQGGNSSISPPVINEITTSYVAGITYPNCVVEIFSDSADEAAIYEGTTNSDDTGNFIWEGIASGPNITATVTDSAGNTSQINVPYATKIDYRGGSINPEKIHLSQNYPNPFHTKTTIDFNLPEPGQVTLRVYDGLGRLVITLASEKLQPGNHKFTWDATGYPAGIYVYHLETGTISEKKTLILRK
jgi:titin